MLVGYDFDGVLCQPPPHRDKKWGKCSGVERRAWLAYLNEWYRKVEPLYEPSEAQFCVLTARKGNDPEVRSLTEQWLSNNFPDRVKRLHMLEAPRSIGAVVAFKSDVINSSHIEEYTEDNVAVVRGIAKRCVNTKVFLFNPQTQERVLQFVKNS